MNSFRQAAKELDINALFIGTDVTELSSALQCCDKKFVVSYVKQSPYLEELLKIVEENEVRLLIPTVDLDLKLLARNKKLFEELGCRVLISEPGVIDICQDKRRTFEFLKKNGFDSPETMTASEALANPLLKFPCFLKPCDGYASRGNVQVSDQEALKVHVRQVPNCIVQPFIDGTEYTCDVFVDFSLEIRCVIPRKRIEVRSGEVSKAQTVKNKRIMEQTRQLVKAMKAGPGIITVQLILDKEEKCNFIELNPRFGGGIPLSIKAGADFPAWILRELTGRELKIKADTFADNLIMLRYDAEIWLAD